MKRKLVYGVIISGLFLGILVSRIKWSHFSLILDRLNLPLLVAGFLVLSFANLVRSMRFRILDFSGQGLTHWWIVTQLYNAITATLPGGAGEAATAYVLKRFSLLNLSGAIRILFMTRVMDLASLSALFLIASLGMHVAPPLHNIAILVAGGIFTLAMIILIPKTEELLLRWSTRVMPARYKITGRIRSSLTDLSLAVSRSSGRHTYVITLMQSAIVVVCAAFSVYLVLISFGVNFTWQQSFYCLGVYAIFQLIPIQGIAGLGTQAAWWTLALSAAGYSGSDTLALGTVLYGTFYIFIALLFLLATFYWFVTARGVWSRQDHVS